MLQISPRILPNLPLESYFLHTNLAYCPSLQKFLQKSFAASPSFFSSKSRVLLSGAGAGTLHWRVETRRRIFWQISDKVIIDLDKCVEGLTDHIVKKDRM